MRYSISSVALAVAPLTLLSNAQQQKVPDVKLDMGDVPTPCKTICQPLGTLSDDCDTDLMSDIDRDENLLQNQCVCTNNSFDVNKVAGLCQDCMHQSVQRSKRDGGDDQADPDDLKGMPKCLLQLNHTSANSTLDIDNLVRICGFGKQHYDAAQTSLVNGIHVSATPATNINQLTKTFDGSNMMNSRQVTTSTAPQTLSTATPTGGTTPTDSGSAMPTNTGSGTQTGGGTEAPTGTGPGTTGTNSPPTATNAAGNFAANLAAAGGAAVAAGLLI